MKAVGIRYLTIFALACLSWLAQGGLHAQVAEANSPAKDSPLYSRRALVIGVAAYQHAEPLKNTLNDARLMAETLQSIGFKLHGEAPVINPDSAALKTTVRTFLASLDNHTEAVIYFAGHGVQVAGDNLLLPTDFHLASTNDQNLAFTQSRGQCVVLSEVLSSLEESRVSLAVLFLDSCRDPGFLLHDPGLIQAGGLKPPTIQEGEILVGFSAKHGQHALDGEGNNSPYTEALAGLLKVPGLSVNTILQRVASAVKRSTDNRQQPYFYGNLQSEVYLAGAPVDARELGAGAAPGVGAPETIAKLLSGIAKDQESETLHRLLGPPNKSKTSGQTFSGSTRYESWSSKQFGLQTWYRRKDGQWALVAYVVHLHEPRTVPIYHGTEENLLFVLGKTSTNQFIKTHDLGQPKNKFEVDLGRWAGVSFEFYLGRLGQYWTYLIPGMNTANGMADANSPIVSYGAVQDADQSFLEHISYNVIAPMYISEQDM